MVKNRLFALCLRLLAFAIAVSGIIVGSGFSGGAIKFFYYTQQSNLLMAGLWLYLIIRTAIGIKRKGIRGSACYAPRFHMACTLVISFTLVLFWCVLAPFADFNLITYGNIIVHAVTPVLAILDYRLFCESGHLKKRDIFLCALLPLAYVIETIILGKCRIVFYVKDGIPYYFPYIFMDFDKMGGFAVAAVVTLATLFIISAAVMYRMDQRRKYK